jgi:hypothetical protein
MFPRAVLALGLFLFAAPAGAQVGSVLRRQPIGPSTGGFTGTLQAVDAFGSALAPLGDLNGDGVPDLAVAAPGDSDGGIGRGAIWILFLRSDGSVLAQSKISQTQGGFTGVLRDYGYLGLRLANIGDLDGDGVPELAAWSGKPPRFWILFLRPDGTLKGQTENLFTDPVFGGLTRPGYFSYGDQGVGGMAALGDLDGDALGDLAIGSIYDPDGAGLWTGALWIVRLKADGTLKAAHKISQTQGGFTGTLHSQELFGFTITQLGDLDGDGNRELGVKSRGGLLWILYLDADERVSNQLVAGEVGGAENIGWLGDLDRDGFGEIVIDGLTTLSLHQDGTVKTGLRNLPAFGFRFEPLGDLDGDGNSEVAAGPGFHTPSNNTIEIVTLDSNAVRNGSGMNPLILSQSAEPVIGTTWSATLDCSGHASGLAALAGFSAPTSGVFTPYGEVLVTGQRTFYQLRPHTGGPMLFQENVPLRLDLFGLQVFVQGVVTGAPGTRLSNALDAVVGK